MIIQILQRISTRERVMLAAFIIVGLLLWGTSLLSRWEVSADELRDAARTVEQQKIWLDSAALFQSQLDATLARLDQDKMLDASALTAFVDSYAREHKLRHELTTPDTQAGKLFTRASIRVNFRGISLEELVAFQLSVDEKRPYLAMEAIALAANRADPRLINARLNLTSMAVR